MLIYLFKMINTNPKRSSSGNKSFEIIVVAMVVCYMMKIDQNNKTVEISVDDCCKLYERLVSSI